MHGRKGGRRSRPQVPGRACTRGPDQLFQETILKKHVVIDAETQHRIPTLEAALVSKYAAMISQYRDRAKKEQDAADFRRMVRANQERIHRDALGCLADEVWDRGAVEIAQFLEIALSDQPFPV